MKKFSAILVLLSALAIFGYSQSIQLLNNDGVISHNSELIQVGSPDSSELITYIHVKNISGSEKRILCKKVQYSLLDSTEITMCWADGCYPSTVFVSPNAQSIAAGATNTGFSGHYTQIVFSHFKPGESLVRWTFFDQANPDDSASVLVKYITWPLGISKTAAQSVTMSNIWPNPASSRANFSYSIAAGSSASIIVRDMVGKTVYSEDLSGSTGKVAVNVSSLPDGIYFCSLLLDGQMSQTRKLVVRH